MCCVSICPLTDARDVSAGHASRHGIGAQADNPIDEGEGIEWRAAPERRNRKAPTHR